MGCCTTFFGSVLTWIAQVLKVAVAAAIIVIVALKLSNVSTEDFKWDGPNAGYNTTGAFQCMLGSDFQGNNLCTLAFAVSAVSIAISICVAILLCCTCDLCGLGPVLEAVASGFGAAMWVATAVVLTRNTKDANNKSVPRDNWRNSVVVLAWINFGLFAFVFLIYLLKILGALFSCCGCCSCGDVEKGKVQPDNR